MNVNSQPFMTQCPEDALCQLIQEATCELKRRKDVLTHSHTWGRVTQDCDGHRNWHVRICQHCQLKNEYGHRWGSNKHASFAPVETMCPGYASL